VAGFAYPVAFIIIARFAADFGAGMSWLLLGLGGIVTTPVLIALYNRVRDVDAGFAVWALPLGVVGALGAVVHGGYETANIFHPPGGVASALPSQIDPRGLLTFGVSGLGLLVFAWLVSRSPRFPNGLGRLGLLAGGLLIIIYLARLIILTSTNPLVLVPAVLSGFIINPAWYIWVGMVLLRAEGARNG
jgi:hypothetical protein